MDASIGAAIMPVGINAMKETDDYNTAAPVMTGGFTSKVWSMFRGK